ncbi:unnamed protein product, partial [Owenia fusiformis]
MLFRVKKRLKWLEILGVQHRKEQIANSPWRWAFRTCLIITFIIGTILYHQAAPDNINIHNSDFSAASRHLLSSESGSNHTLPEWEKCDFEEASIKYLWLVLYILLVLIGFIAVAIVCDDFFVPSLEGISEELKLSEDVAGATFMAAGSSAPELFISVVGVAFKTDVGVGTIVGSAVFNILIIIALTAALAGQILNLDWRPLIRDSFFYGLSIGCFIYFSWDGLFYLHEALILLGLYIIYIIIMVINPKLMAWMATWRCCCCKATILPVKDEESEEKSASPDPLTDHTNVQSMNGSQAMLKKENEKERKTGGGPTYESTPMTTIPNTLSENDGKSAEQNGDARPPSHTDSGFNSHENSGYIHSNHASNTDLQNGPSDNNSNHQISKDKDDFLKPPNDPNVQRNQNGPLPQNNEKSDHTHAHQRSSISYQPTADGLKEEKEEQLESEVKIDEEESEYEQTSDHNSVSLSNGAFSIGFDEKEEGEEEEETMKCICCPCLPNIRTYPPSSDEVKEKGGFVAWLKYILRWFIFITAFPFVIGYSWTIPDCSKDEEKRWVKKLKIGLSFLISVIWIALLSFAMITLVGRSGCILGIDTFTMGLVVIAVGTSVPDAMSSILVARDGFGDMAVSNAIGSNVFDINLGLGLPFLITIGIQKLEPIQMLDATELSLRAAGNLPVTPHAKFGFI